jgi:hypothetical protein
MGTAINVLAGALVFAFVLCCVVSGLLQVIAWSRHARRDAAVSFRAMLHPERYFDAVGQRQIVLARSMLVVGGVAYLSYGVLVVALSVAG